jgi:lipid-A-disaccharide synthase
MFQERGISTHYVGNPLRDSVAQFQAQNSPSEWNHPLPFVALLPGSRKQEIKAAIPVFKNLVADNPQTNFIIAGVSEWSELIKHSGLTYILDDTYRTLSKAKAAVVTSGTATLETALLKIPQIVVYKTDWLFYSLAKLLVKVKYISLINIILNRKAVPELIQTAFSSEHISEQLIPLLVDNDPTRLKQLRDYEDLQDIIGTEGASKKTAELIVHYTRSAK